jgi:hypothetical protein
MNLKKFLLTLLVLVILAVCGGVGYLYISLNSLVKHAVVTGGSRITGTEVTLTSASLSPFSGSGELSGLVIGNPEGFKGPYALRLGSIQLHVDESTLLKNPIVVDSIVIRNPSLCLIGTPFGNNLGKLQRNIRESSGEPEEQESTKGKSPRKFLVREIRITDGSVRVIAGALDQSISQTLSLPDITLRNVGSDGSGVSGRELASQIMVPMIAGALREGITVLGKQGLKELQSRGVNELQKVLPGLFK